MLRLRLSPVFVNHSVIEISQLKMDPIHCWLPIHPGRKVAISKSFQLEIYYLILQKKESESKIAGFKVPPEGLVTC